MRLQQSHPHLHAEKGRTCRQSGDVCYFTQPVAVAVPYIQYPVLWILYIRLDICNIKYIALFW